MICLVAISFQNKKLSLFFLKRRKKTINVISHSLNVQDFQVFCSKLLTLTKASFKPFSRLCSQMHFLHFIARFHLLFSYNVLQRVAIRIAYISNMSDLFHSWFLECFHWIFCAFVSFKTKLFRNCQISK